jgi:hypothetical protein
MVAPYLEFTTIRSSCLFFYRLVRACFMTRLWKHTPGYQSRTWSYPRMTIDHTPFHPHPIIFYLSLKQMFKCKDLSSGKRPYIPYPLFSSLCVSPLSPPKRWHSQSASFFSSTPFQEMSILTPTYMSRYALNWLAPSVGYGKMKKICSSHSIYYNTQSKQRLHQHWYQYDNISHQYWRLILRMIVSNSLLASWQPNALLTQSFAPYKHSCRCCWHMRFYPEINRKKSITWVKSLN